MQTLKGRIKSCIFSKIPFSTIEKLTQTNLTIPYYHMVSDDEKLHIKHLYKHKNIEQFKDDLDFFLKRYSSISLFDVLEFLQDARSLSNRPLLLTFDDGFGEMSEVVAPILVQKGIPATFFVNSAFIDNKGLCYQHKASVLVEYLQRPSPRLEKEIRGVLVKSNMQFRDIKEGILSVRYQQQDLLDRIACLMDIDFNDYLLIHRPYLTSDQIERLIRDGFSIGAHSIDHPPYPSLSLKDQLFQTLESVRTIRQRFGLDYGAFAFPYSDNNVSEAFFLKLYNSGLVNVSFGTSGLMDDTFPCNLQRIGMETSLMPAEIAIGRQLARKLFKLATRSGKIARKK